MHPKIPFNKHECVAKMHLNPVACSVGSLSCTVKYCISVTHPSQAKPRTMRTIELVMAMAIFFKRQVIEANILNRGREGSGNY